MILSSSKFFGRTTSYEEKIDKNFIFSPLCNPTTTVEDDNWIDQVIVSDSNGDFVPINIEDIAQVVEVDEDGSTHRTCLKENSTDPLLGM